MLRITHVRTSTNLLTNLRFVLVSRFVTTICKGEARKVRDVKVKQVRTYVQINQLTSRTYCLSFAYKSQLQVRTA